MAVFTIKVNQYVLPYRDTIKSITEENCDTITKTYPVGVVDTMIGAHPNIVFLLSHYAGNIRKKLYIKNIVYKTGTTVTTGADFSLTYNGTKLSGTTVKSYSVENLVGGDAVPGLQLSTNILFGEVNGKSITFDYSVEDIYGTINPYTTTTISLSILRCTQYINPIITNVSAKGDHDCGTYEPTAHYLTVTLQAGENLKMKITNTVRGLGTFNGFIRRLSVCCQDPSVDTDPYSIVTGFIPSNTPKNVIYNPVVPYDSAQSEPWNVIHLQIFLCMLRMYGDNATLANTHEVKVEILNILGETVHTVTLNESRPGI